MPDAAIDYRLPPGLPPEAMGSVVTVGTFDGVHRGHWAVLQEVRRRAMQLERPGTLVTFHPHPLLIVRPETAPPLLTSPLEKKEILAESGLDYAVFLPFTRALSRYTPERFVEELLVGRLGMGQLVIGYDHGFGRGRSGDPETLRRIGRRLGFDVHIVPAVHLDGDAISSTRIRHALEQGDVRAAADALGRRYSVSGTVVRGEGRGKALGFPTANIQVPDRDKLLPLEGVYAVGAAIRGFAPPRNRSPTLPGVVHLGPRPTFQGSPPSVELHIFDFDAELYGEWLRVEFHARIRDIHHFASPAELVSAIRGDCVEARRVLDAEPTDDASPG